MIALTEAQIDAAAPNADAAKNGRGLVLKGKFTKFHTSEDGSLLFGECQGSGKEPYRCSSDFAPRRRPDAPLLLPQPAVPLQALPRPPVRLRDEEAVYRRGRARGFAGEAGEVAGQGRDAAGGLDETEDDQQGRARQEDRGATRRGSPCSNGSSTTSSASAWGT